MSERTAILTPVGRLVQGDCFQPQTKDANGAPLVIKTGPNAGQPRVDYFMALAIAKTDPGLAALQQAILTAARQGFPAMFDAGGNCTRPGFAFKMVDGDSTVPNTKGSKPCEREGFPGHVVFYFSSGFAPDCYTKGGGERIADPNGIKRGYYIRINGTVTDNGAQAQPGVYLNHNMVELVGYGDEINAGPDGNAVFGGTPASALPAGVSATPLAGPPLALPVTAPPVAAPLAAPPGPVAPAPDFLTPPPAAAPPAPPAPPVAEEVRIAPDGKRYTESALLTAGYTREQLNTLPLG